MIRAAAIHLPMWGAGLAAAARLAGAGFRAWRGGGEGLAALLGTSAGQREVFCVLRAFAPNIRIGRKLITAYENTGTAIVTRRSDVVEVLDREADFAVVYEPKMRAITDGENFFLGMQDGVEYQHDTSLMRLSRGDAAIDPGARLGGGGKAGADDAVLALQVHEEVPEHQRRPVDELVFILIGQAEIAGDQARRHAARQLGRHVDAAG